MKVGFIGLGNVGGKLARSLLREHYALWLHDANRDAASELEEKGAIFLDSPAQVAKEVDFLITCLPEPSISADVMVGSGGALLHLKPDSVWMEMSTTSAAEIRALQSQAEECGVEIIDCPVSGGCHRAATGNISIFAGGKRGAFEKVLPLLQTMGRNILYCGALGSASELKVVTNYLATANLLSLSEALASCAKSNINLNLAYEAIRISSGNSFVHETESQVILNGSRDINFTLGLVEKDLRLFNEMTENADAKMRLLPIFRELIKEAQERYGRNTWSPQVVGLWEEANDVSVRALGFPEEIVDNEPACEGSEVKPRSHD